MNAYSIERVRFSFVYKKNVLVIIKWYLWNKELPLIITPSLFPTLSLELCWYEQQQNRREKKKYRRSANEYRNVDYWMRGRSAVRDVCHFSAYTVHNQMKRLDYFMFKFIRILFASNEEYINLWINHIASTRAALCDRLYVPDCANYMFVCIEWIYVSVWDREKYVNVRHKETNTKTHLLVKGRERECVRGREGGNETRLLCRCNIFSSHNLNVPSNVVAMHSL